MKSDFEKWDWKKEDKEFYDKASKMPEFQDEKYREMMKRQRYNQKGKQYRVDMRPKVFIKKMKLELIVLSFGIGCALMLPFYIKSISKKRQENRSEIVKSVYEDMGLGQHYQNKYGNQMQGQTTDNQAYNPYTSREKGGIVKVENLKSTVINPKDINCDMDEFFMEV